MKEILFKYMTRFTSLNEEEQRAIVEDIVVENSKKEQLRKLRCRPKALWLIR